MTREEFKNWLKADVTLDGALNIAIPNATYERIIDREIKQLIEIDPDATEEDFVILPARLFWTPEFRKNRKIAFPDCVVAVTRFQEMKHRNAMFGIMDPDFGFNKAFMSDLWLGSLMNMDSVAFRTISWSAWDQLKQFTLIDIQHRWNYIQHELLVLGHDPRVNVFCGLKVKVPEQELFDNVWVQKWISAHCKLQANKLLTIFQTNLVGGITVNMSSYTEEANKDIEACKEWFTKLNKVPNMYTLP